MNPGFLVVAIALLGASASDGLRLRSKSASIADTMIAAMGENNILHDGGRYEYGKMKASPNPIMPPCYQALRPEDLMNISWCDPKYTKSPVPKKLQGLYWMKWAHEERRIEDVAVCLSLGEWDASKKTMHFPQNYKQFFFKDSPKANALVSTNQLTGMRYDFIFEEDVLDDGSRGSRSKIDILGKGPGGTATWDAIQLTTTAHMPRSGDTSPMELNEVTGEGFENKPPGEAWYRRTYIDDPFQPEIKFNEYKWVKIMDGDMNLRHDTIKEMLDYFSANNVTTIMHYWDKCPGRKHK